MKREHVYDWPWQRKRCSATAIAVLSIGERGCRLARETVVEVWPFLLISARQVMAIVRR